MSNDEMKGQRARINNKARNGYKVRNKHRAKNDWGSNDFRWL
jgi:hypothetical protein